MTNYLLNISFQGYEFHSPQWLWSLLLIPLILILRYLRFEKGEGAIKFSRPSAELLKLSFKPINWLIFGVYFLIGLGVASLIIAMAKPYLPFSNKNEKDYGEGIDIIITMDVSGSMLATDFLPNRFQAAKQMAKEFIDNRESDYIGFVVFAGEAYTACPATRDYNFLKSVIDETTIGTIEQGTAIGTGLGTAVNRLKSDSLTSKVIILLTDGENNSGFISPMEAAQLAKNKNIKLYTIGIGSLGYVDMPVQTPFGTIRQKVKSDIDEKLLSDMAKLTGGEYFRATDENSLREIYSTINQMETRKVVNRTIKKEPPFRPEEFLKYGLAFLVIGLGVEQVLLRKNG
ncbi:MAG: VWA domain-containing protein [Brumimicrobium sp.]